MTDIRQKPGACAGWVAVKHPSNRHGEWCVAPKEFWERNHYVPDTCLTLDVPGFDEVQEHTIVARDGSDGRAQLESLGFLVLDDARWYFQRFAAITATIPEAACCRKHWQEATGRHATVSGDVLMNPCGMPFIVCQTCGNKRCPRATDCELACTGRNDPGQAGSIYERFAAIAATIPEAEQAKMPTTDLDEYAALLTKLATDDGTVAERVAVLKARLPGRRVSINGHEAEIVWVDNARIVVDVLPPEDA